MSGWWRKVTKIPLARELHDSIEARGANEGKGWERKFEMVVICASVRRGRRVLGCCSDGCPTSSRTLRGISQCSQPCSVAWS